MSNYTDKTVAYLLSPQAVRERCAQLLAVARGGELTHLTLDETKVDAVAAFVLEVTRRNYPDLQIPYHSRWRHFDVGGVARTQLLDQELRALSPLERAVSKLDLAVISVLLDAGAGDAWRYRETSSGQTFARSEGLAVASLDLFRSGALSSDPHCRLRVDSAGLRALTLTGLAEAFQVSSSNPLLGLE
ncbi:MAG: DUF1688 family protein, partial [Betaproteobacteria bacterium]|nr:DUF1688 family protein [Betaproteobacteria bacterium]